VLLPDSAFFPEVALESVFSPVLFVVVGNAAGPAGPDAVSPGRAGVVLLRASPAGGWAKAPTTGKVSKPAATIIEYKDEVILYLRPFLRLMSMKRGALK
jgi:hypothetical protein